MCGLAGFIDLKGVYDKSKQALIAESMANALERRGPDDSQIWQDEREGVNLAFRRLAILDLSAEGRQPMASVSGRYIIVFNGEIYNFQDLRTALEKEGHTFRGRSDTEVILAAFDQWGLNRTLQKLTGMFAFVLWDRQEKTIHFARDRFGQKPLYMGWAGKHLIFASELKAFHAHPGFKKDIDRSSLTNYMSYGYMHAPRCIFKDVWQLLPGARLSVSLDNLEPGQNLSERFESYWFLPNVTSDSRERLHKGSETDIINEFDSRLQKAISSRMISDVPLGAFLSGGIDSSTVVALMQKSASGTVKTFSIGFEEQNYNEAQHAKEIADYLGTDHTEFYISADDALNVIPKLPHIYDEPFADISQIPTYLVSKMARDHVTVALTGDGGDELLGGYTRHITLPSIWGRLSRIPYPLRRVAARFINNMSEEKLSALRPNHPQFGRLMYKLANIMQAKNADQAYDSVLKSWQGAEKIVIDGKEPLIPLHDPSWQPQGLNFEERILYGDNLSYRPNDLMVKSDRASMAVSLEARAPLMDHTLYEFCAALPHHYKVRDGQGKWLLREILSRHIPKEHWDRPKMGFNVPIAAWLQGPLKEWASDLLSFESVMSQGYLDAEIIQGTWQEFLNGRTANAEPLWAALMFQSWHKEWMS